MSTMESKLADVLREAEGLYSSRGLVCAHPACGQWLNKTRDILAEYDAHASEDDARDAARYRWIRNIAQLAPDLFSVVEDAAFASAYGCPHNFDYNIDAAMHGEKE